MRLCSARSLTDIEEILKIFREVDNRVKVFYTKKACFSMLKEGKRGAK